MVVSLGLVVAGPGVLTTLVGVICSVWLLASRPTHAMQVPLLLPQEQQPQQHPPPRRSCAVSRAGLFNIAIWFWSTGSAVCLAVCVSTIFGKPPHGGPSWDWARLLAAEAGLLLGTLQGFFLMWGTVAKSEAGRVAALSSPQAHQFFPAWRLLFLMCLCPTCVQVGCVHAAASL
jgi:hypothetical protein